MVHFIYYNGWYVNTEDDDDEIREVDIERGYPSDMDIYYELEDDEEIDLPDDENCNLIVERIPSFEAEYQEIIDESFFDDIPF